MGKHDFFVGTLTCPRCQAVSEPNSRTAIETRIRDMPTFENLKAGMALEVPTDLAVMRRRDYICLRAPNPREPVRVIAFWCCTHCLWQDNWAEVTVDKGVIQSVLAVPASRETVERVNFISGQVYLLVPSVAELTEIDDAEVLRRLRKLP